MRILVTGGAGFVGSHLVDRLMTEHSGRNHVVVVDNLYTGSMKNIKQWEGNPRFKFVQHDVVNPVALEGIFSIEHKFDQIYHLACPASPPHYQADAVFTLLTNVMGTKNFLDVAKAHSARFLLASTSEIYGDPLQHPQTEEYRGNTSCTGIRACYDEGKRAAETLAMDYNRQHDVQVRIARIFNTYGPRMNFEDGRVISNFVIQALTGQPMTIYGDGSQTRSFCYVSELVDGLYRLMNNSEIGPINLGNPIELTISQIAQVIKQLIPDSTSPIDRRPLPLDDPTRRQPDITKARTLLGWNPQVPVETGLLHTITDFKQRLADGEKPDGGRGAEREVTSSSKHRVAAETAHVSSTVH